jgi:CotS family spore coat protein
VVVRVEKKCDILPVELKEQLNDTVLWEYDLPAVKVQVVQGGYKIETRSGPRFLKVTQSDPEAIMLADAGMRYLIKQGFSQVSPFILTKYGDAFVRLNDHTYYLTKWIKGKELQLGRWSHLEEAVATLARMQASAKGFMPPMVPTRESWGLWPDFFSLRLLELEECLKLAETKDRPSEFDILFLSEADQVLEQARITLEMIVDSPYQELVEEARAEGSLCHHDYTGRNLIRTRGKGVYVVNFDNCQLDIHLFDLAELFARVLPCYGWDLDLTRNLLITYNKELYLDPRHLEVLMAYLSFPQRFWQISRAYYLEGEPNSQEHIHSLRQVLLELPLHQDFIQQCL